MLRRMVEQTSELRKRWMSWFFGDELAPLERVVRSAQLAKLLRFYVDRALFIGNPPYVRAPRHQPCVEDLVQRGRKRIRIHR